jgi:hypothetical protein
VYTHPPTTFPVILWYKASWYKVCTDLPKMGKDPKPTPSFGRHIQVDCRGAPAPVSFEEEMQGFVATCVVVLLSVLVHTATGFNARLQPISLSTSFAASSSPATSRFPSAAGLPPQRMARHSLYSGASTRNLSMQSPASSSTAVAQQAQPTSVADTVIVGSGPTGLAGALMLARRGYKDIHVYDRLPEPPAVDSKDWGDGRNYNVGLSGRGQKVGENPKEEQQCTTQNPEGPSSSHHSA